MAERVAAALLGTGRRLVTAESCTGGWVAKCLTDLPGSSRWFERGYVTYSNLAKQQELGVSPEVIEIFGAVSQPTAEQMASGALHATGVDVALAITGIAGPDGGTPAKPVGLVWLALARRGAAPISRECRLQGDRESIRRASVAAGLRLIVEA